MDWHARFKQQARWTQSIRNYIYQHTGLAQARRVLEVGCGTGALLAELEKNTQAAIHGLDLSPAFLAQARSKGRVELVQGDAQHLPYGSGSFDISLCHFLLMWVANPVLVVAEMRRITRPGGSVLALAEPDYGGRIDFPTELSELGRLQAEALGRQGADPGLGRRLGEIFTTAGLEVIETGVLGGQWSGPPSLPEWELEWRVLEADLGDRIDTKQFNELRTLDAAAWQRGARVLFVPTFYTWGKV